MGQLFFYDMLIADRNCENDPPWGKIQFQAAETAYACKNENPAQRAAILPEEFS
jgi:hypothetical protein